MVSAADARYAEVAPSEMTRQSMDNVSSMILPTILYFHLCSY